MGDRRRPGDLLLHPAALLALGLVIVNDRILKHAMPGAITGKLSDIAGLVYFPLSLVTLVELVRWALGRRRWQLGSRWVVVACVVVGIGFALTKTWSPAAEAYRSCLGVVLWPAYAIGDLRRGFSLPAVRRFDVVEDRTDLVALVALLCPIWVSRRVNASNTKS